MTECNNLADIGECYTECRYTDFHCGECYHDECHSTT
jgi:hypothetical protein